MTRLTSYWITGARMHFVDDLIPQCVRIVAGEMMLHKLANMTSRECNLMFRLSISVIQNTFTP